MGSSQREIDEATNRMLDAFGALVDGKDNDDIVFVDGALRSIADRLGLAAEWPEIEPMTAGEFRRRWRDSKAALAAGDGPKAAS